MDFRTLLFGGVLLLFFSCGTKKESSQIPGEAVEMTVYKTVPYCGGAAPIEGDEWPKKEAMPAHTLSLTKAGAEGKKGELIKMVLTDEQGKIKINLPKGKYQLWHPDKSKSFKEFMEINKKPLGNWLTYGDDACFKEWHERPDFEFEVGEQTNFEFYYENNCFTGIHPCLEYSGPYPP